jgi:hypothetical protein
MILAFNVTLNYISVVAWWSNVFLWRKPETHGENLLQIAYKLYHIYTIHVQHVYVYCRKILNYYLRKL